MMQQEQRQEHEKEKNRKQFVQKLKCGIKENPVISYIVISLGCGIVGSLLFVLDALTGGGDSVLQMLFVGFFTAMLVGAFLVYPAVLSFINLVGVFLFVKEEEERRIERRFEIFTIVLGFIYTMLVFLITDIQIEAQWFEQLYNSQVHQPIWTDGAPTVIVFCVIGIIGYLILSCVRLEKIPPLVVVLSMSAMYLGILECVVWIVQTMSMRYWILSVFPVNCVIIAFKTIRYKITEWNCIQREKKTILSEQGGGQYSESVPENKFLCQVQKILAKAELWPVLAFLLMWPLLGILLGILILLGQKPDAMIKAWTETADWRLSQQVAPQNAMYDEHYLCTVAAGGHEKVVKPLRMGERHGHRVVVNRQLCIANAFEQILEEKTPRFHRVVRHFYDTYGFPISGLIRTKASADVVYILMKPLEWIFLAVIYLCDVKPENRIAVQYLPHRKIDI